MPNEAPSKAEQMKQSAGKIMDEWFDVLRTARDQTEAFVRERPLTSAAIAFAAGCVLGAFLRRK